jgi:outer membrane protein OmpA-like peptidoglycan-associated protein
MRWRTATLLLFAFVFSSTSATTAQAHPVNSDTFKSQRHLIELGIYLGALFPDNEHALYNNNNAHQRFNDAAFDVGARIGYFPIPYFGMEFEGGIMPTAAAAKRRATLYAVRGHLIGQYPARFSPFVLAGVGALGVFSGDDVVGFNTDFAGHFGLGLKFYATHYLAIRLDGRYNLTIRRNNGLVGHFEALAGASFLLGWKPPDSDGDGVIDEKDKCPKQPAKTKDGCPPKDSDSDGIFDKKDKCPYRAGNPPDGCPLKDSDGDGIADVDDKCPKHAAKSKDGCPLKDADGDGIIDAKDGCPQQKETVNRYQDEDGCPDVVPEAVKRVAGAMVGIYFTLNRATIRRDSFPVLDEAAEVLKAYPDLNVTIIGHTDNTGPKLFNQALSLRRAQITKAYLMKKGIAAGRLNVKGVGALEPAGDNETALGRAKNRRIEFRLRK